MLTALRLISPTNLRSSRTKAVLCIFSKQSPVRQIATKTQLKQFKVQKKILGQFEIQQRYGFHTSRPRHIPPVVALLIRPVVQVTAFIFGRLFKKWWKKKSPGERQKYLNWFITRKKSFYGFLGFFLFALFVYYVGHLQTDPITKRPRFIIFTKEQQAAFAKLTLEMILEQNEGRLLPHTHPAYRRLINIIERILKANQDLQAVQDKEWSLTVVDEPIKNAYVLPGGNIFVFKGALNLVENDDQLAIILAHEMAHELLNHSMEQVSRGFILDIILTLPIVLLWAFFPDVVAALFQVLGHSIINIFHNLPYSRALESEADEVGLILAAKACFDVREAVVFWGMMRMLTELNIEKEPPPILSTHPDHGDREKHLNEAMPHAIALRNSSGCSYLSPRDPRNRFYMRTKKDHKEYFSRRGIARS